MASSTGEVRARRSVSAAKPTDRWGHRLALAAILVLAFALRLYRLDAQSIWYDEGWSIHLATSPIGAALEQIGSEGHTHPPGYYLLLMGWVRVFGSGVVAVRGLSVALGVATVWAMYSLAAALFGRRAGLVASALLALAPAHIVYSQETRMYALLLLALAAWLQRVYVHATQDESWTVGNALLMAGLEITAIYTHYFSFFVLLSASTWLLLQLVRQAKGGRIRGIALWAFSQVVAFVAFVPWLGVALRRALGHAPMGVMPAPLASYLWQVWSFLLGGHIALAGRERVFAALAVAGLATAVAAAVVSMVGERERRPVVFLALQCILPLVLVFVLTQVRPGFHPRYLLMLIVPILLLMARGWTVMAERGWASRSLALVSCTVWLATSVVATRALQSDPYYNRDDARATAAYLNERLEPGSLVLVDVEDWALRYYLGDTELRDVYVDVAGLTRGRSRSIEDLLVPRTQAALVRWHQGSTDKAGLLPYLLERAGALVETRELPGYTALVHELDGSTLPLMSKRLAASFGSVSLVDMALEGDTPTDEAICVALTWRVESKTSFDLKAAIKLRDVRGRELARCDASLRDVQGRGTAAWPVGEETTTYHTIPLQAGIAPLSYELSLGVYHEGDLEGLDALDEAGAPAGKSYLLGSVDLARARGRAGKSVDRERLGLHALASPQEIAPGLALAAHGLDGKEYDSGSRLSCPLEWHQASDGRLPDYWPKVQLVRDGATIVEEEAMPVDGRYPTDQWEPGEVVLDFRDLIIPPSAPEGEAEVQIVVDGHTPLLLGTVQIKSVPRVFDVPEIQVETDMPIGPAVLVGYDLAPVSIAGGYDITLTLHWQASARPKTAYVIFTHLLSEDGRLVAQHDGPPVSGQRPTTGWIAGEYVSDTHVMRWVDPQYRGAAYLEVGMYDPVSGERVRSEGGDSRLLLPGSIMVQ